MVDVMDDGDTSSAGEDRALPLVCVLLSLYNGERYLSEQLESLADQEDVRIHIEARDDGSSDASVALFERTCARLGLSNRVSLGANVGAAESFLELMFQDLSGFDYIALCDQDDVWKTCKLSRAVRALEPHAGRPALYGAAHTLTDARLRILSDSKSPSKIDFGNSLVENLIQGATAVMNRAGIAMLQEVGRPRDCVMHDWWCSIVFSALGSVTHDSCPTILYRQHESNLVGTTHSFVAGWSARIARHLGRRTGSFYPQAREFGALAGDKLPAAEKSILDRLLQSKRSFGRRVALAFDRRIWRQERLGDLGWRLLVLLGRY